MKLGIRALIVLMLIGGGALAATNPTVQQTVMGQVRGYYAVSNNPNAAPNAVVCNVPLAYLIPSVVNIITTNPKGVCLGGLTLGGGAPILGDVNQQALINIFPKFNQDLQAHVVNNVLICQVPCTNGYAYEIQWCNDLSGRPPQQSFSIPAQGVC